MSPDEEAKYLARQISLEGERRALADDMKELAAQMKNEARPRSRSRRLKLRPSDTLRMATRRRSARRLRRGLRSCWAPMQTRIWVALQSLGTLLASASRYERSHPSGGLPRSAAYTARCVGAVLRDQPPYFGLRDYGVAGQIGLEASPDAYIAEMVAVFREVRRVLRDDGTLWLNLGDSYNNRTKVRTSSHQPGAK